MLEAVEKVVADAQSHRVRHPETLEEVEVEVLFLLALVVVVGVSLVDLYLVRQWLGDITLAHALRAEERGLGEFPLLLAERNHTVQ